MNSYYTKNKERILARSKERRMINFNRDRELYWIKMDKKSAKQKARRLAAIEKMGGKCDKCGISDTRVLCFDHLIPAHRKTNGLGHGDTYISVNEINESKSPRDKYGLLCFNCNRIKVIENCENHRREFLSEITLRAKAILKGELPPVIRSAKKNPTPLLFRGDSL